MKVEPSFDRYIFIERDAKRCTELLGLKAEFPSLADNIVVEEGEANAAIQSLCAKDWKSRRAVLFLDPYGMQVEWQTIEAIARTKGIDLWLLFPLGRVRKCFNQHRMHALVSIAAQHFSRRS